jgi:pyridoxine kinase
VLFHGTGDVFSSAFTGAFLRGKTAIEAAAIAVDFVVESIKKTLDDIKAHSYGVKFEKAIPELIKR